MQEIFKVIVLGLVEGITEFLPISSTGHLILADKLLGLQGVFTTSFNIAIQLGAILAVVWIYFRRLLDFKLWKQLIVAFLPTAVIGLALYKFIKIYLLNNSTVVLWALALGGVVLIIFEIWYQKKSLTRLPSTTISFKNAFIIGIFQSLAIVPGVSRSAATIVGGMWLGISRTMIVEFSFLLAIPTMAAATGLDLLKNASTFNMNEWGLLVIGFIISFFTALLVVKWLLNYIKNGNFIPFAVYRIVAAIAFYLILFR